MQSELFHVGSGFGDSGRAERLYAAHIDRATRFAFLLTGHAARAQDLAQDAFLRCLDKVDDLAHEGAFGAYLRKAVYHEVLMESRSRSRERVRQMLWFGSRHQSDEIANAESRTDLVGLVHLLPLKQRTTVVLRFWADLPEKEIAEAMGCSVGTVKSNLSRALTTIRKAYPDAT